jgi:hypothetical protein
LRTLTAATQPLASLEQASDKNDEDDRGDEGDDRAPRPADTSSDRRSHWKRGDGQDAIEDVKRFVRTVT